MWQGTFDRLYINGTWTESTGRGLIEVVSPVTEGVIATVPSSTAADVDRAVAAARHAFEEGPWPRMDMAERIRIIERFRDAFAAHAGDFAGLITAQMGCPVTQARGVQVVAPLGVLDGYLDTARRLGAGEVRVSANGRAFVVREPVGVVAAIVPWNVPQTTTMEKVAPALLAGCSVILKPAPETPLDAYLLAELLERAGLPAGVVNVVPADREASEYLVSHPGVDKVSFTGSTAAGRRIAAICGNDLRRVTLELGGKSAGIVLDDADLDATVESLRVLSLRNSGQVCSLKTRLLVSRRQERELVERLVALVSSMPVGDPADEATQIGPMASKRQRERVEEYIASGVAQGARPAVGGQLGRPSGLSRGWFVHPTVFEQVSPGMRIEQEEIFGPVLSVIAYESIDEAVAIANGTPYGLSGSVFTADVAHGIAVARRLRTGSVEVNGASVGFSAPVGGFKTSGLGREQGIEGLSAYVELRSIGLPDGYEP